MIWSLAARRAFATCAALATLVCVVPAAHAELTAAQKYNIRVHSPWQIPFGEEENFKVPVYDLGVRLLKSWGTASSPIHVVPSSAITPAKLEQLRRDTKTKIMDLYSGRNLLLLGLKKKSLHGYPRPNIPESGPNSLDTVVDAWMSKCNEFGAKFGSNDQPWKQLALDKDVNEGKLRMSFGIPDGLTSRDFTRLRALFLNYFGRTFPAVASATTGAPAAMVTYSAEEIAARNAEEAANRVTNAIIESFMTMEGPARPLIYSGQHRNLFPLLRQREDAMYRTAMRTLYNHHENGQGLLNAMDDGKLYDTLRPIVREAYDEVFQAQKHLASDEHFPDFITGQTEEKLAAVDPQYFNEYLEMVNQKRRITYETRHGASTELDRILQNMTERDQSAQDRALEGSAFIAGPALPAPRNAPAQADAPIDGGGAGPSLGAVRPLRASNVAAAVPFHGAALPRGARPLGRPAAAVTLATLPIGEALRQALECLSYRLERNTLHGKSGSVYEKVVAVVNRVPADGRDADVTSYYLPQANSAHQVVFNLPYRTSRSSQFTIGLRSGYSLRADDFNIVVAPSRNSGIFSRTKYDFALNDQHFTVFKTFWRRKFVVKSRTGADRKTKTDVFTIKAKGFLSDAWEIANGPGAAAFDPRLKMAIVVAAMRGFFR